MTDDDLRKLLAGFKVPAACAPARERARHRATLALGQTEPAPNFERAVWFWRSMAGALAIALAGALAWQSWTRPAAPREDVVADEKILEQIQVLFPREVDAIVEQGGKIDLSVAQSPEVGSDQPIVVLFRRKGQTIRVLSYSGHRFCLPLDGQKHCFEILAAASGGVILEKDDSAWLAADNLQIAGYSVRAQALEASL